MLVLCLRRVIQSKSIFISRIYLDQDQNHFFFFIMSTGLNLIRIIQRDIGSKPLTARREEGIRINNGKCSESFIYLSLSCIVKTRLSLGTITQMTIILLILKCLLKKENIFRKLLTGLKP